MYGVREFPNFTDLHVAKDGLFLILTLGNKRSYRDEQNLRANWKHSVS